MATLAVLLLVSLWFGGLLVVGGLCWAAGRGDRIELGRAASIAGQQDLEAAVLAPAAH